jgi:hypothetical protein
MATIIALRGRGNSGKSQTIRLLHGLLLGNGYQLVRSNLGTHVDFTAVFKKKGKLIGITSAGDTFDLVRGRLQELINDGCEICVCACRTHDRDGHGTNAAIDTFTNYEKHYFDKTISDDHGQANHADAQRILDEIERLI